MSFENKKNLVNGIFSEVAEKYDIMNDLMSFGIHRLWKDAFCKRIPNLNTKVLDVASGSGDIALRLVKRAKKEGNHLDITLTDVNSKMLETAKTKAIDNNILNLNYLCADAEKLPFPDNSFDYYTIAFGIRNVTNIENVLKEAFRVLKPHGQFLCLEFSKVQNERLDQLYSFYSFNIIPKIGQIVAHNVEAYKYLVKSINLFPDQETFKSMISSAGFSNVTYENLTFGVVAIHSGYKIASAISTQ